MVVGLVLDFDELWMRFYFPITPNKFKRATVKDPPTTVRTGKKHAF